MRFIFRYPDPHDPEIDLLAAGSIATVAQAAERAGFDLFALTDHPAPSAAWLRAGGHQTLDPFVGLGFAAAATSRLEMLTYLVVAPYRNPLLLAKSAATLDVLSGGRLVLGLGTGYLKSEFAALGVDFERRNELFDEMLQVLPLAWSGQPFDFAGPTVRARGIQVRPAPSDSIPLWIGGNSERTLQRVAESADGWMPLLASEQVATTSRTAHLSDVNALSDRIRRLEHLAGDRFSELDIVVGYSAPDLLPRGTNASRVVDEIAQLGEAGVTALVVSSPPGTAPTAEEFIAQFHEGVMASFTSDVPKI